VQKLVTQDEFWVEGSGMLIGVLMSAISGGMTALVFTLAGGHSFARVIASYPLGGMLAVGSFLAMSLIRKDYEEKSEY
jgi:hypothetical protein